MVYRLKFAEDGFTGTGADELVANLVDNVIDDVKVNAGHAAVPVGHGEITGRTEARKKEC